MAGSDVLAIFIDSSRVTVSPSLNPASASQTCPAESVHCAVAPASMRIAYCTGATVCFGAIIDSALLLTSDLPSFWHPMLSSTTKLTAPAQHVRKIESQYIKGSSLPLFRTPEM